MTLPSPDSVITPRFAAVIVAYRSRLTLEACLRALREEDPGGDGRRVEIIVVDNASDDGTADWLAEQADVRLIANRENLGFSRACNQGARIATAPIVIFLNPDTRVTPGCFGHMAEAFTEHAVGAVGPLSDYVAGRQRLDLQWPAAAPSLAALRGDTPEERCRDAAGILAGRTDAPFEETRLLIGFCLMMPRALYLAMGGMDENLFLGNDDLDLSWRLRLSHRKLAVAKRAFVHHAGQKSFATEPKSRVDRLVQESTDALYRKLVRHYGGPDRLPSPLELWGMDWFRPSPSVFPAPSETAMENQGITTLVHVRPETSDPETALVATLNSLPMRGDADVIVLNRSSVFSFSLPGGDQVRRLDLSPQCGFIETFTLGAGLARGERLLLLEAGQQSTAAWNGWMATHPDAGMEAPLPFHPDASDASDGHSPAALACLCARSALVRALQGEESEAGFLSAWKRLIATGDKTGAPENRPPWNPKVASASWTAVPESVSTSSRPWAEPKPDAVPGAAPASPFDAYPETLRAAMREAGRIAFAGTKVAPLPQDGPVRGVGLDGSAVDLDDQDLLILRLSPDMLEGLEGRLANLRRRLPALRNLVAVFDSGEALGKAEHPRGFAVPVDLTARGVRAALRLAGFHAGEARDYPGFPGRREGAAGGPGWLQIEAAPREAAPALEKKVSIILLGFNQVEYTRACVESIRRNVRQAHELILVDNGSRDGTADYFRSVPGAKVIVNAENLGVSAGWNRGLRAAQGDYLLILNNDTLVGEGMIENLVRLCESDPGIGMAGPRCNRVAAAQAVEGAVESPADAVFAFQRDWQQRHELGFADWDWVKGVCMLIPRAVFERVGFFDERFGKGNFEDDDYCLRVRHHGYRTCIAHDAYLHHVGSVSFNQEGIAGIDWEAQMRENHRKFQAKWARGRAALYDVETRFDDGLPAGPEGDDEAKRQAEKAYADGDVAGAKRLLLALQARRPEDPEILSGLAVCLYHENQARESALLSLRSLLLRPEDADTARNLLDALEGLNGAVSPEERASLAARFPSNPVLNAGLPKHTAAASLAQAALPEWRRQTEALLSGKAWSQALEALSAPLQRPADRPWAMHYLGLMAAELGRPEEALDYFTTSAAGDPSIRDNALNRVDLLLRLGRREEAFAVLESEAARADDPATWQWALRRLTALGPDGTSDPTAFLAGCESAFEIEALLTGGNFASAEAEARAALKRDPGHAQLWALLGVAAWNQQKSDCVGAFCRAVENDPELQDAWENLADAAHKFGAVAEAQASARRVLERQPNHAKAASLLRANGPVTPPAPSGPSQIQAPAMSSELLQAEEALKSGRQAEALKTFLDVAESRPENPKAWNGLGIIAFAQARFDDAFALFSKAAALDPSDQDTLLNFWDAARATRQENRVLPALKESLERHPEFGELREIVEAAA